MVEPAVQFDHLQGDRRGKSVPENWDPAYYRDRAKAWRDKAASLPEDHSERAVCCELADGYDRLATLLEQRRWHPVQ
jgi:hypothetical protein